ncbi:MULTISPECIES: SurA N-terminal domain-containing protein [unclassified Peribacillus]|uniref:SurA N-terminal domain-containing protein n=1 Tax=unclassified Peribacillus TaxID=2675266 RepID=UPI0019142FD4|nr:MULTISPECIES: SurA N-terminal domain-containing protein [unclassified Peribacillus]MBK5445239.1 SurA N-terminal domain-containing protein [Peribacillus sp. TH24]MBK5460036.1 SurA N-terminal domain-containing protein [Peribacillus sp. TH27]MBK5498228.1 SurA N-terminal domain-containing protein [Peribacillus sp. TH14]
MKKLLYPIVIGLLAVFLTACGSNDEADKKNDEKETAKTTEDQQKQMEELQKKLDKQKVDEKKTVAIVNDEKISGAEYNNMLSTTQMQMQQLGQDPTSKKVAEQIKEQTINSLVGQRLLLQAAEKKGYTASKDEIEKQLAEMKGRYENDEKFNEAMKQAGLNLEKLKTQIAKDIPYTKYVDKEIKVEEATDEEIEKYYDQVKEQAKASGQEAQKLEEMKPQIKKLLEQQKKQEKLVKHVEELQKDAKVKIKI